MAEGHENFNEYGYPDERFETALNDNLHLHCAICSNVFKDPVMCKNEHCFCRGCLTRHLQNFHNCPSCNQDLSVESLTDAPRILRNLLSELRIRCDYHERGCQEFVQLGNLASHVATCGKAPVACANEECSCEVNRQDQARHESEECRFRKMKCRSCTETDSMVREIGARLGGLCEQVAKLNTNVNEQLTEVKTGLTAVENRFVEMENRFGKVEERFEKVESKLEGMENRFEGMENRYEKVESRLENVENRFKKVENGFEGMENRYEKVESRFEKIENGFGEMENRFEKVENGFEGMENRFEKVENRFENVENRFEKAENQLLNIDLRFRDGQRESTRSDQATQADQTSDVKDAKNPNEYAYVVAGGYGKEGKPLSSAEIFDKTTNSWRQLQPMKNRRAKASSVVYNGQVLVAGGISDGKNVLGTMEQLSRNPNPLVPPSWSNFPVSLPCTLTGQCTVLYNDSLLIIRGDMIYEVQLHFPFNTKVFAKMPSLIDIQGCGVVLVNDKILIFGGGENCISVKANVTMYDITKNEFKELAPLPYKVFNMATVKFEGNVILAGGTSGFVADGRNTVISYNIETEKSVMLPPMKNRRVKCSAVVDGDSMMVIGGVGQEKKHQNSVEAFDFRSFKWRHLPPMIEPREGFVAGIV